MAAVQRKVVHKQFNSPIGLYSDQNVKETLNRELRAFSNGTVGIGSNETNQLPNLANSAVLRALEEEEAEKVHQGQCNRPSRSRTRRCENLIENQPRKTPIIDRETVLAINRRPPNKNYGRNSSWPASSSRSTSREDSNDEMIHNKISHLNEISDKGAIKKLQQREKRTIFEMENRYHSASPIRITLTATATRSLSPYDNENLNCYQEWPPVSHRFENNSKVNKIFRLPKEETRFGMINPIREYFDKSPSPSDRGFLGSNGGGKKCVGPPAVPIMKRWKSSETINRRKYSPSTHLRGLINSPSALERNKSSSLSELPPMKPRRTAKKKLNLIYPPNDGSEIKQQLKIYANDPSRNSKITNTTAAHYSENDRPLVVIGSSELLRDNHTKFTPDVIHKESKNLLVSTNNFPKNRHGPMSDVKHSEQLVLTNNYHQVKFDREKSPTSSPKFCGSGKSSRICCISDDEKNYDHVDLASRANYETENSCHQNCLLPENNETAITAGERITETHLNETFHKTAAAAKANYEKQICINAVDAGKIKCAQPLNKFYPKNNLLNELNFRDENVIKHENYERKENEEQQQYPHVHHSQRTETNKAANIREEKIGTSNTTTNTKPMKRDNKNLFETFTEQENTGPADVVNNHQSPTTFAASSIGRMEKDINICKNEASLPQKNTKNTEASTTNPDPRRANGQNEEKCSRKISSRSSPCTAASDRNKTSNRVKDKHHDEKDIVAQRQEKRRGIYYKNENDDSVEHKNVLSETEYRRDYALITQDLRRIDDYIEHAENIIREAESYLCHQDDGEPFCDEEKPLQPTITQQTDRNTLNDEKQAIMLDIPIQAMVRHIAHRISPSRIIESITLGDVDLLNAGATKQPPSTPIRLFTTLAPTNAVEYTPIVEATLQDLSNFSKLLNGSMKPIQIDAIGENTYDGARIVEMSSECPVQRERTPSAISHNTNNSDMTEISASTTSPETASTRTTTVVTNSSTSTPTPPIDIIIQSKNILSGYLITKQNQDQLFKNAQHLVKQEETLELDEHPIVPVAYNKKGQEIINRTPSPLLLTPLPYQIQKFTTSCNDLQQLETSPVIVEKTGINPCDIKRNNSPFLLTPQPYKAPTDYTQPHRITSPSLNSPAHSRSPSPMLLTPRPYKSYAKKLSFIDLNLKGSKRSPSPTLLTACPFQSPRSLSCDDRTRSPSPYLLTPLPFHRISSDNLLAQKTSPIIAVDLPNEKTFHQTAAITSSADGIQRSRYDPYRRITPKMYHQPLKIDNESLFFESALRKNSLHENLTSMNIRNANNKSYSNALNPESSYDGDYVENIDDDELVATVKVRNNRQRHDALYEANSGNVRAGLCNTGTLTVDPTTEIPKKDYQIARIALTKETSADGNDENEHKTSHYNRDQHHQHYSDEMFSVNELGDNNNKDMQYADDDNSNLVAAVSAIHFETPAAATSGGKDDIEASKCNYTSSTCNYDDIMPVSSTRLMMMATAQDNEDLQEVLIRNSMKNINSCHHDNVKKDQNAVNERATGRQRERCKTARNVDAAEKIRSISQPPTKITSKEEADPRSGFAQRHEPFSTNTVNSSGLTGTEQRRCYLLRRQHSFDASDSRYYASPIPYMKTGDFYSGKGYKRVAWPPNTDSPVLKAFSPAPENHYTVQHQGSVHRYQSPHPQSKNQFSNNVSSPVTTSQPSHYQKQQQNSPQQQQNYQQQQQYQIPVQQSAYPQQQYSQPQEKHQNYQQQSRSPYNSDPSTGSAVAFAGGFARVASPARHPSPAGDYLHQQNYHQQQQNQQPQTVYQQSVSARQSYPYDQGGYRQPSAGSTVSFSGGIARSSAPPPTQHQQSVGNGGYQQSPAQTYATHSNQQPQTAGSNYNNPPPPSQPTQSYLSPQSEDHHQSDLTPWRHWSHVKASTPTHTGYNLASQNTRSYQDQGYVSPSQYQSQQEPYQPQSTQAFQPPASNQQQNQFYQQPSQNEQKSYQTQSYQSQAFNQQQQPSVVQQQIHNYPFQNQQNQQQYPSQFYNQSQQQPQYYSQAGQQEQQQPQYQQQSVRGQTQTPPGIIQLRKEAPISQEPSPVYTSQPAAAKFDGGSNMRGDLKWPPPEYKVQAAIENEERRKLALGPVCRPRLIKKDYRPFFAKHALNANYPGYKAPPGTQHMYVPYQI